MKCICTDKVIIFGLLYCLEDVDMLKDMLHDIRMPRNKNTQNPGLFPTRIIDVI